MATQLPEKSTIKEAAELMEQYPYFTLPAILALKQQHSFEEAGADLLASRVAVSLTEMSELADVLGQQTYVFDNFYPDEQPSTPTTEDTIDTFLSTFGRADRRETDAISKLIFNPTPDYASILAAEEKDNLPSSADLDDANLSEQDRLINTFIIGNHNAGSPNKPECADISDGQAVQNAHQSDKQTNLGRQIETSHKEPQKDSESNALTESFVRILIKNRNYSKAIEIISDLRLKNPEKSIYFADQIRFLQKLIINENKK